MATLSIGTNYLNPYEQLKDQYKGTPLYNELGGDNTWTQFAKEGRLDNLVALFYDASNYDGGIENLKNKYKFKYLDADGKVSAVANELYGDKDTLNKYYLYKDGNGDFFYSQDANLLNDEAYSGYTKEEVELTEYDYNKASLDRYANYIEQRDLQTLKMQEKQDMNGFVKFLASTYSPIQRAGVSAVQHIQNFGEGIGAAAAYLGTGIFTGDWEKADAAFDYIIGHEAIGEDYLVDFESKYTYWRDVNGNYVSIGAHVNSIATSIGQMLPTVALSFIPVVGQTAGNVVYWTGLFGSSEREFALDENMASTPTGLMIASAGIKATLQYGVTKVLTAIMGEASLADKLVFGYGDDILINSAGSVVKKLGYDAIHEGIEEAVQEFTDMFTDSAMSLIDESFGVYGKRTAEDYINAFVLGAITSILTGGFGFLTQSRLDSNVPQTDKNGNIKYNRKGEVKYKKLGRITSFNLKQGIKTINDTYNQLISNTTDAKEAYRLTGQLAVAVRAMSSIYTSLGDEKFRKANEILSQVASVQEKASYTMEDYIRIATDIVSNFNLLTKNYKNVSADEALSSFKTSEKAKNIRQEIAKKIADAKVTTVERVVNKGDITSEITAESKKKFENEVLSKIFDANPDVNKVLVTKDGTMPVQVGDTIVVSENQIQGLGDIGIQKSISEQRLVDNVASMQKYKIAFKQLIELWNKLNPKNKISKNEDIIYQVFFNDTFFKIALQASNIETSKFLTALSDVEKSATSKTSADAQYKTRINNIFKNRYGLLVEYYINQQEDTSYKTNSLFDNKTIKFIDQKRTSKDLYNRIINGEKLSQDDISVISQRINYLPIKLEAKEQLRKNIFSEQKNSRVAGMNMLSEAYKNIFTSPYDGKIYLTNDGLGNISWNVWAQKVGITLKTLSAPIVDEDLSQIITDLFGDASTENVIKFYQQSFKNFTNDTYLFEYRNGRVLVKEYNDLKNPIEKVDYKVYPEETYDKGHIPGTQTFVLSAKVPDGITESFLQKDTPYSELITFDDMVKDTSILSADVKNAIISSYGKLNSRNAFLYLRSELNKQGYTLSVTKNGQFILSEVKKALSILKNPKSLWQKTVNGKTEYLDLNKEYFIQDFIKPEFRDEGLLKEVKVKFTTESEAKKGIGSYYNPNENVIVLDRNGIHNVDYMNASLLHEYQHAVQFANNWNGGISATWITDYNLSSDMVDRMLKDLNTHLPELYRSVVKKSDKIAILERFVYETSGEAQALGIENNAQYNVVYPTIVNVTQNNGYIVMPWGTKYKIIRKGYLDKTSYSLRKGSNIINFVKDVLDPTYFEKYYKISKLYDVTEKDNFNLNSVFAGANEVTLDYLYGFIATNDVVQSQEYHKEQYERSITPERKIEILKIMNHNMAKNVPFEDFLNMDIPAIRFQFGNYFMYDEMSSFCAGDTSIQLLKNIITSKSLKQMEISTPYIFVGTFKPKDIISYMHTNVDEVLLKPSVLSNVKQYKLNYEIISTGVNLSINSVSDIDIRSKKTTYLTQNIPQDRGSIKVLNHLTFSSTISNTIDNLLKSYKTSVESIFLPNGKMLSHLNNYFYFMIFPNNKIFGLYDENVDYYFLSNLLENARQNMFTNEFSTKIFASEFERYTNSICSITYNADYDQYYIILGNNLESDYVDNIAKIISTHANDIYGLKEKISLVFDTRYFKFQTEFNLENSSDSYTQIKSKLTEYIDNVNEYVKNNQENELDKNISNIQPSNNKIIVENTKGKGVYNLFNDDDISEFLNSVKNVDSNSKSQNVLKYKEASEKTPIYKSDTVEIQQAKLNWFKSLYNLTDESYVPIMIFTDKYGNTTVRIPVDEHPTYDLNSTEQYTLQTGIVKAKYIKNIRDSSNGLFRATIYGRKNVENLSSINDIEFDKDMQGFTITNPETDIVFNKQSFAKPRTSVPFSERRKNNDMLTGEERNKARYVSNKKAQGTNLQYFIKKNVPIRMDPAIQDLVINLDLEQTDKGLRSMIDGKEKGTLNKQRLFEYIRKAKNINDYTFKMINKYIFKNPAIKNFKQLKAYADISPADYFALRTVLQTFNKERYLERKLNYAQIRQIIEQFEQRPDWNELYKKVFDMYNIYRGKYALNIDSQNMRIMFMKYFDGSIASGADVAAMARWIAVHNYNTAGNISTTSIDKSIGEDITIADTIADTASSEFVSSVGGYVTESEMMDAILDYRYSKLYSDSSYLELSKKELSDLEEKIASDVEAMTSDEIVKEYTAIQMAEEDFTDDYFKAVDEAVAKEIRPRKNILQNIKRMANVTIAQNLSKKSMERFSKANPDIFNEDGKLNENLYKGVSYNDLISLENRIRSLSKAVRDGMFNGVLNQTYLNKISRLSKSLDRMKIKNDRLKEQNDKLKDKVLKYQNTQTKTFAENVEFTINSDIPMPEKLSSILSSAFEEAVKTTNDSKVKFVTEANVENAKISMSEFIEKNSDTLSTLVQGEVDDIIDYYSKSLVLDTSISRNYYRAYQSYEIIILSYFLEMQRSNIVQLTDEQVTTIKNVLNSTVSNAATLMATWQEAMKLANPTKIIVQSLRRSSGLDISENDVNSLTAALNLSVGDELIQNRPDGSTVTIKVDNKYKVQAISKAMHDIEQNLLEQYKIKQKRKTKADIIFTKLTDFRRMMMLSGPGTAIRNLSSNAIVYSANIGSGKIGSVLTKLLGKINKKLHKNLNTEGQWDIADTKVPDYVKAFTENFFEHTAYQITDKNGKVKNVSFYDAISDGLTKYDPRKVKRSAKDTDVTSSTGKSLTEMASELMIQKVVNNIYNRHRFDSTMESKFEKLNNVAKSVGKGLNKVNNFVFWLLQDDYWIKKTTKYYFERMLTESKMPLRQGVSTRTLDLFAEAYTKAAYDFMHKPNVWNKIEQSLYEKAGPAAYFLFKTVFPFASASWNWFVEGLNYTPIGLAKGIIQFAKLENTIQTMDERLKSGDISYSSRFALYEAKKTIGKGVIGSIGTLVGILLAGIGLAGIDEQDNKLKLRVADVYIDISDLFASQGILTGLAIMSKKYDSEMDTVSAIITVLDSLFADSIFTDLYNSFQRVDSIGEWMLNETEEMLTSYVPNFLKTFNSLLYTHQIDYSSGLKGSIEYFGVSLIPGLAYALPKRYDPYTGEVKVKYKLQWLVNFINKLSPFDIMPYNVSELEKEALLNGVRKGELTGRYSDIGQFNTEQIAELNKKYGELNKYDLDQFINNNVKYSVQSENGTYKTLSYKDMTSEQRKRVIERIMSNNALYAKIYVYTQIIGKKYYANSSEYNTLKSLGIVKNVYRSTNKLEGFIVDTTN